MKYVIIGSGVAAFEAANTIRNSEADATIAIYTQEAVRPYRRPALSKLLCSEIVENQFYIKPESFFAEKNIDIFYNHELLKIDRETQTLHFANQTTATYDKLLLTVGGHSFVPPIAGVELDGVYTLRDYADLQLIRSKLTPNTQVAIIGGGILGLELAESLEQAKYQATIIEGLERLLPRILDPEESQEMAQTITDKYEIALHIGSFPKYIEGKEHVEAVILENGTKIPCDMVIFSAGVRPNVTIAQTSGLETTKFGIVVNDYMQTSDANIYAAGDCISLNDKPAPGLYLPARDMGICAGKNLTQTHVEYIAKSYPMRLQSLGFKIIKP